MPAERIIFTGDLLATKFQPGMSSGHPDEWLNILAKIKTLNPSQLLPGHGGFSTLGDMVLIERDINELLQMAKLNLREGGTAESTSTLQPPAFTNGWENAEVFPLNMKFLHEVVQSK